MRLEGNVEKIDSNTVALFDVDGTLILEAKGEPKKFNENLVNACLSKGIRYAIINTSMDILPKKVADRLELMVWLESKGMIVLSVAADPDAGSAIQCQEKDDLISVKDRRPDFSALHQFLDREILTKYQDSPFDFPFGKEFKKLQSEMGKEGFDAKKYEDENRQKTFVDGGITGYLAKARGYEGGRGGNKGVIAEMIFSSIKNAEVPFRNVIAIDDADNNLHAIEQACSRFFNKQKINLVLVHTKSQIQEGEDIYRVKISGGIEKYQQKALNEVLTIARTLLGELIGNEGQNVAYINKVYNIAENALQQPKADKINSAIFEIIELAKNELKNDASFNLFKFFSKRAESSPEIKRINAFNVVLSQATETNFDGIIDLSRSMHPAKIAKDAYFG